MFTIPTKLALPLPEFLTREYFESGITAEELLMREDFIKFMIACDQHVTNSAEAEYYLELFSMLMLEQRFLPATDLNFDLTMRHAQSQRVTAEKLERALALRQNQRPE